MVASRTNALATTPLQPGVTGAAPARRTLPAAPPRAPLELGSVTHEELNAD